MATSHYSMGTLNTDSLGYGPSMPSPPPGLPHKRDRTNGVGPALLSTNSW